MGDRLTGYDFPDRPFTVTKTEAAVRQVEVAIAAMKVGDYDIAITLAGAAEDMLDRPGSLLSFASDPGRLERAGIVKKELIAHINEKRDWLKHDKQPDSMKFTLADAGFMIARALTKLPPEHCTPNMTAFVRWWLEYVSSPAFD